MQTICQKFPLNWVWKWLILFTIWLTINQIWAVMEGSASLTQFWWLHLISFWSDCHQKRCGKVGSLSLVERLVRFEQRIFWFHCNAMTHYATLRRSLAIYLSNSVIILVVKFCWLSKIVFHILRGLFFS